MTNWNPGEIKHDKELVNPKKYVTSDHRGRDQIIKTKLRVLINIFGIYKR